MGFPLNLSKKYGTKRSILPSVWADVRTFHLNEQILADPLSTNHGMWSYVSICALCVPNLHCRIGCLLSNRTQGQSRQSKQEHEARSWCKPFKNSRSVNKEGYLKGQTIHAPVCQEDSSVRNIKHFWSCDLAYLGQGKDFHDAVEIEKMTWYWMRVICTLYIIIIILADVPIPRIYMWRT